MTAQSIAAGLRAYADQLEAISTVAVTLDWPYGDAEFSPPLDGFGGRRWRAYEELVAPYGESLPQTRETFAANGQVVQYEFRVPLRYLFIFDHLAEGNEYARWAARNSAHLHPQNSLFEQTAVKGKPGRVVAGAMIPGYITTNEPTDVVLRKIKFQLGLVLANYGASVSHFASMTDPGE